ncbi:AI-2E family transporter [soil metagenome]
MIPRFYSFLLKNQVIFALILLVGGYFIYSIRGILVLLFLSYIIMAALLPAVHLLLRFKFPRVLAVLIPFIVTLCFLLLMIFPLIPFFFQQIESLFVNFPLYIGQTLRSVGISLDVRQIQGYISPNVSDIGRNAFAVSSKVFGGLISTLTILIVSFYLLLSHDKFQRSISKLFHRDLRESVVVTMNQIDDKLGAWMRGQLVLCLSIGVLTWIALSLLNLPYALPLALIAAIFEALPTIGPILAAVPALIVAFTLSPNLAIFVAIIYFIIQTLENNVLVPKIMQHAVGLNPVIVIVGIMIGGSLMGIPGALLSIPFISFLTVLFSNLNEID